MSLPNWPLGRVAYLAYGDSTGWLNHRGEPMPAWEGLPESIRLAWVAAAAAAVTFPGHEPREPARMPDGIYSVHTGAETRDVAGPDGWNLRPLTGRVRVEVRAERDNIAAVLRFLADRYE